MVVVVGFRKRFHGTKTEKAVKTWRVRKMIWQLTKVLNFSVLADVRFGAVDGVLGAV